jgi:thiol-disulfide isomerase/thioredoxin
MKNNVLLYSLFALSIVFTIPGCKAQPQNQITGQIKQHPDWKPVVYLIQPRHFPEIAADYLGQVIDSASISKDGTFSFKSIPVLQQNLLLELAVQKVNNRFANHLMDTIPAESNYMPLVLTKGEPIKIKADASAFQQSLVFSSPSIENKTLLSLRDARLAAFEKFKAALPAAEEDSLLIEKENIYQQYAKTLMDFADTTISLKAAMVAIRWISPSGDFERMPEFIAGQCQKWSGREPEDPFTKELCALAVKNKLPAMLGDVMPEFLLPLVTGDTVKLSSLLGKKLTLVDFWASWCAPCRKEIREELIPLWKTYHDQGFQIVAYSLDASQSAWVNAIKKDGSTWTQASHLTGDSTPFMQALRITTIPANYILDAKGKIVAKNVHGQELEELVRQHMQ